MFKNNRIATALPTDRIGKVFYVLDKDMRICLVCEGIFTCRAAAEHAATMCLPSSRSSEMEFIWNRQEVTMASRQVQDAKAVLREPVLALPC